MREFEASVDGLQKGLSPYKTLGDVGALERCINLWTGDGGLSAVPMPVNPYSSLLRIERDWPFPQLIVGESKKLMVVRTADSFDFYEVTPDYDLALVARANHVVFPGGGKASMADFGEHAFLVNGAVALRHEDGLWIMSGETDRYPLMKCVCNFNGQAFGGGVTGEWFDCDETYVLWSKIGELDFRPDRKNTAGYRKDFYGGEILWVSRLGGMVAIYSTKGVSAAVPVTEPAPTFGFRPLFSKPVVAAGGNEFVHAFVTDEPELYMVDGRGEVTPLGYRDSLSLLSNFDVRFNGKVFFISDGTRTFIYHPGRGLSEATLIPYCLEGWNGLADEYEDEATLVTDPILCRPGGKTVFGVNVGVRNCQACWIRVHALKDNGVWAYTPYVRLNAARNVSVIIHGQMFKVEVKLSGIDDTTMIDFITVKYKLTDLRHIRGVTVTPKGDVQW